MDIKGADGETYAKGSAIPLRADFNTLDNPFFWTSDPERDRHSEQPDAGLHFITFNPSSDDFRRNRLAMDGVLPDGTELPLEAALAGPGPELRAPDDAPAELHRPSAEPPQLPAGGAYLGRWDRINPSP